MTVFGSICSGIEAASQAWLPLGWRCAFMSEIEAFPRALLSHHYPGVPLHGDFTTLRDGEYEAIDALVGGTPCQSFSVAGLRGGMADERGNLALEYLRLAERLRPRWLVWENVPGVLSSGDGRDFGAFVGGLAELGYGWAYRVLDAQYFGLAQRRKRVFVVGYLGDWRRAAAVLFEPASLRWHPAPSRATGERVADSLTVGANQCSGTRSDFTEVTNTLKANGGASGGRYDQAPMTIAPALSRSNPYGDHESREGLLVAESLRSHPRPGSNSLGNIAVTHSLRADGFDASEDGTGRGTPLVFNHKASAHQSMNPGPISPGLDIGKSDGLAVLETLQPNQYTSGHASIQERHANSLLSALRQAIGEEAFAEWRSGILDSFQSSKILRPQVYGGGVRCETDEGRRGVDDGSLSRATGSPTRTVRDVRQAGRERRSPPGRGLSEQLTRELGAALSELSHEGASSEAFLRSLRRGGEGSGILQPPLPSIQRGSAVRRLTPRECERLMGFPDDYTLIPYRGKPASDGPRYRALGNSMAVPYMAWIGKRIDQQIKEMT